MWPRLFSIDSFSVPTYGVLVALGFLAGLYLMSQLSRRAGLDLDKMMNLGVYVALAAILGAKVFMILVNLDSYLEQPSRIFSLNSLQAGGVFYGGLLAALAVAVWYSRASKLPVLMAADVLAPAAAIGHSIGRLGCFTAGCCWGKPSSLPWAVAFTDPIAHEYVGVPLNIHLHPTQLYEAIGTFVIGILLLRLFGKPHSAGSVVGWYCILYSSFRFGVEFLRAGTERLFPFHGPFSTTQWIALLLVASGIFLLNKQKNQHPVQIAKRAA